MAIQGRWILGAALALVLVHGLTPAGAGDRGGRGGGGKGNEAGMVPPYRLDTWSPSETVTIVPQPDGGRYELHGDGVSTPYHWVWVPASGPPPGKLLSPYGTERPGERPRY